MQLPRTIQEIADVIGRDRALFLVGKLPRCYSGLPGKAQWRVIMYVPKRMGLEHELVRILGWPDANKLRLAFPGEILQPANGAEIYREFRDKSLRRLNREYGHGEERLAEWFGLSSRHVKNVLAFEEIPQEVPQAANDESLSTVQCGAG